MAHVRGRELDLAHELLLHFLHDLLFAHHRLALFLDLRELLIEILFELFASAHLIDGHVDPLIDGAQDLAFAHVDTIDLGLVEVELLDGDLFGDDAVGIAVEALALVLHIEALRLHVGAEDGLVTDHPDDLVHHVILSVSRARKADGEQTQACYSLHFFLLLSCLVS